MEFLKHLPTEVLIGLILLMFALMGILIRIVYKLLDKWIASWNENMASEFGEIKKNFVTMNEHFDKVDRRIDLLFIEIKASDFANDEFLSNGRRYLDVKETEKQRLIRDYELQNV